MTEKLLVVEDEQNLRKLYKMELEEEGYDVVTAADGKGALEKLNNESVDLVVLDLVLPDGSGLKYLQEFMDLNRDIKVVINTAYTSYKMDFHSWTADAFLVKSSDLSELKDTIEGILHPKST